VCTEPAAPVCSTVTTSVCEQVLVERCVDVEADVEAGGCGLNLGTVCRQVNETRCDEVNVGPRCVDVPKVIPRQSCKNVPREVCETLPSKLCNKASIS
jgi:hypothetical protein